jgi:hypothetical protein
MVTSITPNASLRQLAINCSTPSDTCKGVGFVTPVHAEILAKKATTEVSGEFRKTYPGLPSAIGDYGINRQVVLACQQTGGGLRMASTFCGVMSVLRRSGWNRCFTTVEEQLGKAIILLGERIMQKISKTRLQKVRGIPFSRSQS